MLSIYFYYCVLTFSPAWEELAVYNFDFIGCFDGVVTVQDLNLLEMHFLNLIQYLLHFSFRFMFYLKLNIYNVHLKVSNYAQYYFDLKKYSKFDESRFPLMPLTKERGAMLEVYSSCFFYWF